MPIFTRPLPLSLYIHLPWCVRKCPYCDFNSHALLGELPEAAYVSALLQEIDCHLAEIGQRPILSIFFGGGTPSLFSVKAIDTILNELAQRLSFSPTIEITLEANPGTVDQARFQGFRQAGVNRLSLGIQSLQNDKLSLLGRIHDSAQALRAIEIAQAAGFSNFNLDIMYGLPQQSVEQALADIDLALACQPTHFSWYQLTLEPNTLFYHQPPQLPSEEVIMDMQIAGQARIQAQHFQQYEVSAYAKAGKECLHNRNYWEFGDYLGIGAGAHSKLTAIETDSVWRFSQVKHPKDYLNADKRSVLNKTKVSDPDLIFEFMLNALRLTQGVPLTLFTEHTGLALSHIEPKINAAKERGLLLETDTLCPSALGKQFLNDLTAMFLP